MKITVEVSAIKWPKKEDTKKEDANKASEQQKMSLKPVGPSSVKGGGKVIVIPDKEPIKLVKGLECFDEPTY